MAQVEIPTLDWSGCPLVRREAGKLGGAPNINGYRIRPESILGSYESGLSIAEIAEQFPPLTDLEMKTISDYATQHGFSVYPSA